MWLILPSQLLLEAWSLIFFFKYYVLFGYNTYRKTTKCSQDALVTMTLATLLKCMAEMDTR